MSDEQITLRETIENAVTEVADQPADTAPTPEATASSVERARDEKGRFATGGKPAETAEKSPIATPVAADAPPVQRAQRPSSWKKEYWDHWDKIDPNLANYLAERERQFASGVSTYKNEYEQVKPFKDAIEPFLPTLEQAGITPQQWLNEAGNAYRMLTHGTAEQKLGLIVQLAQTHGIPLQHLFAQGQDGKIYLNPSIMQAQSQQQPQRQAQPQQQDVRKIVQEIFEEQNATQQIAQFSTDGKHPHFDAVRETMAGLLQAGLVSTLEEAYATALHMPKHSELSAQLQQQQVEADDAKKRESAAAVAAAARAKAVSPKSSSPAGNGKTSGSTDIRSTISSAFDEVMNG